MPPNRIAFEQHLKVTQFDHFTPTAAWLPVQTRPGGPRAETSLLPINYLTQPPTFLRAMAYCSSRLADSILCVRCTKWGLPAER